jgi:predicted RND superfamily exporter protein
LLGPSFCWKIRALCARWLPPGGGRSGGGQNEDPAGARKEQTLKGGVKQGLFLRIEEYSRVHYRRVFLVTLLLVLGSIYLGSKLTLDGDVLSLLPKNNRPINTFRQALRDFGGLDYLLVLVEAREGQSVEDLQEFADLLSARLQKIPDIRYVEHRIDTSGPFFEFFRRNEILFLPPGKLPELEAKFTDDAIFRQVRDNARQLSGPSSFLVKKILEEDPFWISPMLLQEVLRSKGPLKVDLESGYYLSRDGTALLLIAKPTRPAQDIDFTRKLLERAHGAELAAAKDFARQEGTGRSGEPAAGSAPPEDAPTVSFGGGYVIAMEDSQLIRNDMMRNGTLSFFVIVGLYAFCYRRVGAILYSSMPLVVGQFFTLAVAYVFLRHLNSATTGFWAMLMGLGTDFTIVMYARYVEERQAGHSLDEALTLMMGTTAFGVFTGAITSAGTFYAMCVTEYKGLWDFGFLVGTGILLCLVAILFLLPAMIAWNEGRQRKKDITEKLYLHSFGIQRLITWSTRYPWAVIAGSVVVTAAAGYLALHVEFSDSVQELRSRSNKGIQVQEEIAAKFGAAFNPMMVICTATNPPGVLEKNLALNRKLDRFVADGTLSGYESILTYLPPQRDQAAVIEALRKGSDGPFNLGRIEGTFRRALSESGFRAGIYDDYLKTLPVTLRPERPVSLEDLQKAGLDRFVSRYVRMGSGGVRSVTYLFPASSISKREIPRALVKAVNDPDHGVEITGVNVASAEMRRIFRRDAWRAVLLGIALVAVLLWMDFRSLRLTLLANVQLLSGVIWMLAGMQILGIKMNFINAFVTTMILGVGIDYGIHIIHRISQEGLENPDGLLETGKAVVMAAMTNVAGFGTVGLSSYPGLSSMGMVCVIGSITCLITALTTLPALLIVTHGRPVRRRV